MTDIKVIPPLKPSTLGKKQNLLLKNIWLESYIRPITSEINPHAKVTSLTYTHMHMGTHTQNESQHMFSIKNL